MPGKDSLDVIVRSNLKFSNSMYQILAKTEGNVFFSPISAEVILALTYLGARGRTYKQMAAGLHLPADSTVVQDGFYEMLTSLKGNGQFTLEIANKFYAEKTTKFEEKFVAIARKSFLSDAENVDFKEQCEAVLLLINKWVESKTNNCIKDALVQGSVDRLTKMVLVNTVYFKADWKEKFKACDTTKSEFFLSRRKTCSVDMMKQCSSFNFTSHRPLGCKVLEMPYAGNKLSMVIFLPNKVDGLPALEAKLSTIDLPRVISKLVEINVIVFLPKFKMEVSIDLKPVLQEMGMVDMFHPDISNLTGIADLSATPGYPLYVDSVFQKAFITVDEDGTEAGAVTRMILAGGGGPPPEFNADHPFLFMLRDMTSGAVIFMGRVVAP